MVRVTVLAVLLVLMNPVAARADGPAKGTVFKGDAKEDHLTIGGRRSGTEDESSKRQQVLTRVCPGSGPGVYGAAGACDATLLLCGLDVGTTAYFDLAAVDEAEGQPTGEALKHPTVVCIRDSDAPKTLVTERDFRRLRIPAPDILAQPDPALGHTLINIETNFLTAPEPVVIDTTVLGQPVRVRATPSTYRWTYGDGSALTTRSPGGRYPNMLTPHIYRSPGTFTVQLSTTFTGEFSVGGGPWQPIEGTASAASDPVRVVAEERRAVLIS